MYILTAYRHFARTGLLAILGKFIFAFLVMFSFSFIYLFCTGSHVNQLNGKVMNYIRSLIIYVSANEL